MNVVVAMAFALAASSQARADTLDDIQRRGALIWGADQEGGGPYVYPDPADPNHLIGFEVELAELLAKELGVAAKFHQADWATLPNFLGSGEIDIVLNGYEWTPQRAAQMLASRPYYIYELQLMARADNSRIRSWDDLNAPPGKPPLQVSVLVPSAASNYLHEHWEGRIKIVEYDGNTNAMLKVQTADHDATLQDLPIAIFYRDRPQGRGLRFIGEPVAPGYYVIYARRGEMGLISAINAALERAMLDHRLQTIYAKYGLWNGAQETLPTARPESTDRDQAAARGPAASGPASGEAGNPSIAPVSPSGARGLRAVRVYGPFLARAAWVTVKLSVMAMPLAILLGLTIAVGRMYGPALLRIPLGIYVEVLRGTPVMLQLYVIYFLLPRLWQGAWQVRIDPLVAAVVGLAINYSAYEAEIYRAGLQAIPKGQMEAALALGMTRWTALRRIIIPQAARIALPPVTNDFIALFKDTSICSAISVVELTKQYNMMVNNDFGAFLELAVMTAVLYLAMSFPLSLVARRLERHMAGETSQARA